MPGVSVQKLGQPVPLSNFHCDLKSGRPQPRQAKTPWRCSLSSGLVNGASVPSWRSTSNDVGRQARLPLGRRSACARARRRRRSGRGRLGGGVLAAGAERRGGEEKGSAIE